MSWGSEIQAMEGSDPKMMGGGGGGKGQSVGSGEEWTWVEILPPLPDLSSAGLCSMLPATVALKCGLGFFNLTQPLCA